MFVSRRRSLRRPRVTSPTAQPDGLTADQAATLSSLQKVDDYPLYTMRYVGAPRGSETWDAAETSQVFAEGDWACSLFAALGDPDDRLFGRNFDWRYSPALLLFTDRPAAGSYASVSMVDIAYLGFDDRSVDLTTLPLTERRGLLDAPSWPFDGMNEAGVAVGMAAVPSADERHDPGKPTIDSLEVMRAILDRAGSVDEAVAILGNTTLTGRAARRSTTWWPTARVAPRWWSFTAARSSSCPTPAPGMRPPTSRAVRSRAMPRGNASATTPSSGG